MLSFYFNLFFGVNMNKAKSKPTKLWLFGGIIIVIVLVAVFSQKSWMGLFAPEEAAVEVATELVFNSNGSDPEPKLAFETLVKKFQTENPSITVKLNIFDHESFKTSIRNFLSSKSPDVVTWFAGNRMKSFVDLDLLEDVSDVWADNDLSNVMSSSKSALTVNGKQYGVPYSYYQWGIYYRKDIFDQHGLAVPTNWDEFLAVGRTLKENGIAPVAIGTKFLWTAAGWFDYLNMRINGLPFHIELTDGKVPYTDDRVRAVFQTWKQLLDEGFFIENHATYSWQEAQPFVFQGKAAMYLIGNFFVPFFPEDLKDDMGYFQFPTINPDLPKYEDAPIDTLHIPARATNKADARKFLAFIARADNQRYLSDTLDRLPPNNQAGVKDDRFLTIGNQVLSDAAGLAQFYDRDTTPEMAKIGMEGFQEFMIAPDRLDAILEKIEKGRQRIFN